MLEVVLLGKVLVAFEPAVTLAMTIVVGLPFAISSLCDRYGHPLQAPGLVRLLERPHTT